MQGDLGNSDAGALADSDCSQKFSAADSGENFIRSYLKLIGVEPGSTRAWNQKSRVVGGRPLW
jgi:hypothetical protein